MTTKYGEKVTNREVLPPIACHHHLKGLCDKLNTLNLNFHNSYIVTQLVRVVTYREKLPHKNSYDPLDQYCRFVRSCDMLT